MMAKVNPLITSPPKIYSASKAIRVVMEVIKVRGRTELIEKSMRSASGMDLLRVAEKNYYHPQQQGSWSIKKVLPAIAPDLSYDALEGVQNGGLAMEAFLEAISPTTTSARKAEIEKQLITYCGLDTFAMVRLWQFFSGRSGLAD